MKALTVQIHPFFIFCCPYAPEAARTVWYCAASGSHVQLCLHTDAVQAGNGVSGQLLSVENPYG